MSRPDTDLGVALPSAVRGSRWRDRGKVQGHRRRGAGRGRPADQRKVIPSGFESGASWPLFLLPTRRHVCPCRGLWAKKLRENPTAGSGRERGPTRPGFESPKRDNESRLPRPESGCIRVSVRGYCLAVVFTTCAPVQGSSPARASAPCGFESAGPACDRRFRCRRNTAGRAAIGESCS